jgi:hypothetical protein
MRSQEPPLEHAGRRHWAVVEIAVALNLLAFAGFVILSNWFDWDHFLSFSEVDRRSWVLDHRAPLWSYQLCAGITRIGDPQAFGLSPLFMAVILFGSFWGTKLAVLVSAAVGLYFTTKLLALFADFATHTPAPRASLLSLATLFVTSNFFLWHLLVGHFTFVSVFFALGIIFYTLQGYLHGLRRRDFLIGALVVWQHYSGGFFHSTAYLLVPFFIAFSLFAALAASPGVPAALSLPRPHGRRLVHAASFHLCGLAIASYKLVAVWHQQHAYPRFAGVAPEQTSLWQLLVYQLIPTVGPRWLIPLESHWDIHESSVFSLLSAALMLLGARWGYTRIRRCDEEPRPPRHPLTGLVVLFCLISASLGAGGVLALRTLHALQLASASALCSARPCWRRS